MAVKIKDIVVGMLDDKAALAEAREDAPFQSARREADALPPRALTEAKAEHSLKLCADSTGVSDLQQFTQVLKLALILVFQDGFLKGLQLGTTEKDKATGKANKLTIPKYYQALKSFPDLEETIGEIVKRKLEAVAPRLEEVATLPSFMGQTEKQLVLDTLLLRECNMLLDFSILAGKACAGRMELEERRRKKAH